MAINICKENKLYGFTLIELLAVILILGIIALIAISTVNNVLDEARQRSLSATINSVEKAVSSECEVELLKEKDFTNKYTITDGVISPKLDIKGNLPKNGFIEVSSKCEVKIYAHDGKYCANKNSIIFNIDKQEKNDCIPVVPNDNCFYFSNGVITNYKDSCPKSIIIPDTINEEKVIEIASNAFSKNDLTNVTIPLTVTKIGSYAFQLNKLNNIIIPSSVQHIGAFAFFKNKLKVIKVPDLMNNIESGAFNNNQLPDDQAFIYARNADGTVNKSTIVSYGGSNRQNVTIPDNVVTIGDSAFYGTSLWNITIPSSVETIGAEAFVWGYLKSITIPASVKSIGNWAFGGNSITTINMPGRTFNDLGTDWYTGRPTFNFD